MINQHSVVIEHKSEISGLARRMRENGRRSNVERAVIKTKQQSKN
jgi:hypothetical protein